MLLAIIGKCVLTEFLMTVAVFIIDIVARKVYNAGGKNDTPAA